MRYQIFMETKRNGVLISGWYTGTGFGITTDAKSTYIFSNKEFVEHIAEQLAGRKVFLDEILFIRTKVMEVD